MNHLLIAKIFTQYNVKIGITVFLKALMDAVLK